MKKSQVLALILLLPILTSAIQYPAEANIFKRVGKVIDVTNEDSGVRRFGRGVDPTNRQSTGGRLVKKALPVACGTAGAIVTAPATLTAAGVLVTVGAAGAAHQGCYKVVEQVQR
jgi:hypothetical protein